MFEAQTVNQQQTSYASDLDRPPGIAAVNMWFCAAVLVAFAFTMNAKPAQHLPQKRQSPSSLNCTVSTDCYPPNLSLNATLPETYILCRSSECICEQCFVPNQTSGRCQVDEPCQRYSVVNQQCVDDRRSQLFFSPSSSPSPVSRTFTLEGSNMQSHSCYCWYL